MLQNFLDGDCRVSPPHGDCRVSPPHGDCRVSPPHGDCRVSPPHGDLRFLFDGDEVAVTGTPRYPQSNTPVKGCNASFITATPDGRKGKCNYRDHKHNYIISKIYNGH